MRRQQQAQYRSRLTDLYRQINENVAALDARIGCLFSEDRSEEMDRAQAEAPEPVLHGLEEKQRGALQDVVAALERIEAGTYGDCLICGSEIAPARLEVVPMARYCVPCQERVEEGLLDAWDERERAIA